MYPRSVARLAKGGVSRGTLTAGFSAKRQQQQISAEMFIQLGHETCVQRFLDHEIHNEWILWGYPNN
jgi:hypothetical protein